MKKDIIFSERWWLDCVTMGAIEYVDYHHSDNIKINIPLYKEKIAGITRISMPPYTRTMSPELSLTKSKYFKRGQNIRHLVDGLVGKFPSFSSFQLFFEPKDETLFAFELAGFNISSQYTFLYDPAVEPDEIWNNCDQKTRNLIRTTAKKLDVEIESDVNNFITLSKKQRKDHNTHDYRILEEICSECVSRSQICSITAYHRNIPIASAVVIWGARNMYFWQSARDPDHSFAGANSLLLWEAIKLANTMKKILDFDSYGSISSAKFLASFGLPPVPRPLVQKISPTYALLKETRKILPDFIEKHNWNLLTPCS